MEGTAARERVTGASPTATPGDRRLEALFRREYEPMHRLAYTLPRSGADAEEVVQEAFLAVIGHLDDIVNPGGYLRTTVVNAARKRLGRRPADVRYDDATTHGEDGVGAHDGLDAEIAEVAEFAIAAGGRYRDVLCDYREFGEFWPPWADGVPAPVLGHRVDCIATLESELTRASGIELDESTTWMVGADGVLYRTGSAVEDAYFALDPFLVGFGGWLRAEHPDVLDEAGVSWDPYAVDFDAASLPAFLPLLDDYLDADARWPVVDD